MPEFDGPWKEALTALFKQALRFYRPDEAKEVDWQRGCESLDTEMQKLLEASETGVKRVDKLIKVWLHSGDPRYYHIEIQCWVKEDFEFRVYIYNSVAEVLCGDPVDSLIILGDDNPTWLPHSYSWQRSCCGKTFTFEPLKLLRWRGKEQELFASDNPFALFILAHLTVWATEGDDEARAESKLRLLLRACSLKMTTEDEVDRPVLLRLIDWLLPLPRERNVSLWEKIRQLREGESMPFVSWFEEQQQKCEAKGLHKGITAALKIRFGAEGEALAAEARKQEDLEWLDRFLAQCETASLDELQKLLP